MQHLSLNLSSSEYVLLGVIMLMLLQSWRRRISPLRPFLQGARSGFLTSMKVVPSVCGYVVAFSCFRLVGGFAYLTHLLHPLLQSLGMPDALLPLVVARPFSGALASGLFVDLAKQSGGASLLAHQAAVMLGSTETTIYVVMVYFAAVGVRKTRYAIPVGLGVDLLGCWLAVWVCMLWS